MLLAAVGLLGTVAPARAAEGAGPTLDAVRAALGASALGFDADRAASAAAEAAVRSADPGARLLDADEARRFRADRLGLPADGAATASLPRSVLASLEVWPEGLAYLQADRLAPGGGAELVLHLRALEGSGVRGLVLDLRGAGGADLQSVSDVAALFRCPGEPLFRVEDRSGQVLQAAHAAETGPLAVPLVVLVDRGTHGAAELLAAVLRGAARVVLVGQPTSGDAVLRDVVAVDAEHWLLVATRRLAAGDPLSSYQASGVQPDLSVVEPLAGLPVELAQPPEGRRPASAKSRTDFELVRRVAGDGVLSRAVDLLLGMRALGVHESF
jgi:hypothetical protein